MLEKVVAVYREFRLQRNQDPDGIYLSKQWPEEFQIKLNNRDFIPEIKLAQLKEQPSFNRGTSVDRFIEVHDNKRKMDEVIQEVKQQERQKTP